MVVKLGRVMSKVVEKASLSCKAGSKDAVYHIKVIESDTGEYTVEYQNGRAGGALTTGMLTGSPVDLETAKKLFKKKVESKLKASPPYKLAGESGTSGEGEASKVGGGMFFTEVAYGVEARGTGLVPQLQNEIDHEDAAAVQALIDDPNFIAEHKHDGHRRGARSELGLTAVGSNRKGMEVALPVAIGESLAAVSCAVDGEIIDDKLYVFDVYEVGGSDVRGLPLRTRKEMLRKIACGFGENVRLVRSAYTAEEKRELLRQTKLLGQEGVVFKDLNAAHAEGRPNSAGPQLKLKHWKKAQVIVVSHNQDRRSVVCGVHDATGMVVEIGSVTIAKETPPVGSVILVKYLYVFEGGAMFEPSFKHVCDGVDVGEASLDRLHFKRPHVDIDFSQTVLPA